MSAKSLALILSLTVLSAPLFALTSADYLASGRDSLFSGTVSGVQQAHATFEQALSDASCPDCQNNREILFFHALSRIAMWAFRQDGAPVDSLLEACEELDAPVTGDVIRELIFTQPDIEEDRYGRPILPRNSEQMLTSLLAFIDSSALPEVEATIAQLDRITETPDNRFRVFLTPAETSVFLAVGEPIASSDIEVDYAEVMMLKGVLHMIKGFITAQSAWDTNVSGPETLYYRHWENCLSFENDILLPNPDFLRLLPTANDPSDGAAILLQARQDILTALQYYLDMITYVRNEDVPEGTDPQDDELLSIDPDQTKVVDSAVGHITDLMNSLVNDTPFAAPGGKTTEFQFETPDGKGVSLAIKWGPFDTAQVEWFSFWHEAGSYWFDNVDLSFFGDQIYCTMEGYTWPMGYIFGYFSGTLSCDRSTISDPYFQYHGSSSAVFDDLVLVWNAEYTEDPYTVDANPVLGGSPRYPQPVSPRDLLFEFDPWNKPVAGTLPDPTLGGILPEATDLDWTRWVDPQPAGTIDWPIIQPWQIMSDMGRQWPAFWLDEQCVFTDATGELDEGDESFDISKVCLGLEWNALYGSILLASDLSVYETTVFEIYFSPNPNDRNAAGTLLLRICVGGEGAYGSIFYRVEDGGPFWAEYGAFDVLLFDNQVDFRVSLFSIPTGLAGRYLSIDTGWMDPYYICQPVDENSTHVQLGVSGTVSGTVTFDGWLGGPVIVQAFSDLDAPEDSLLAYTVLEAPGEYTLAGIAPGWNGYIRAISPLFGSYHPLDMDAIKAECIVPVSVRSQTVSGIDLDIQISTVLPNVYWYDHFDDLNTTTNRRDVFAFDAIAGAYYQLVLNAEFSACMSLMDRNGSDPLVELQPWQTQNIGWICPVNGRYYVEISESAQWRSGGGYSLSFGTSWYCPGADISSARWSGVKDCRVDLADFALLAGHWLADCGDPYWCAESDYDRSGSVELNDVMQLLERWLAEGGPTS